MRSQDDERWSQQVADLHADGEPGQRFLDFFTLWFDTAETMLAEGAEGIDKIFTASSTVHHYVEKALEIAENELGFLSVDLIGQMLTVASMHWAHGAAMVEQLTFIEQRVMEEALARKIAALQESAKE